MLAALEQNRKGAFTFAANLGRLSHEKGLAQDDLACEAGVLGPGEAALLWQGVERNVSEGGRRWCCGAVRPMKSMP
jgi:hypothetical protein